MKNYQPERFESMKVNDLVKLEKWLMDYKLKRFNGQVPPFIASDDVQEYDDIKQKIQDVRDAILSHVTKMQKDSRGSNTVNERSR